MSVKKALAEAGLSSYKLPPIVPFGNKLRNALNHAITENGSRRVVLYDNDGVIGVLLDRDEFNLLIKAADLLTKSGRLTERKEKDSRSQADEMSLDAVLEKLS